MTSIKSYKKRGNTMVWKIFLPCGLIILVALYFLNHNGNYQQEAKDTSEISTTVKKAITAHPIAKDTKASDVLMMDTLATMIGMNNMQEKNLDESFSIAILDTGVYPHPDIAYPKNKIVAFVDLVNGIESPYDDNGHGTGIVGIIAGSSETSSYRGLAPFVDIVSVKVLDYQCKGYKRDIIEGIQWVIDNKERYNIKLMNISIGIPTEEYDELSQMVDEAYTHGIFVVTSAGNKNNDSEERIYSPAISDSAISVGSIEGTELNTLADYYVAEFSSSWTSFNGHRKPEVVAPGENIVLLKSDIYYKGTGKLLEEPKYTNGSGTSLSAAVVTAFIADLIYKHPDKTVDEIKEILYQNCTELKEFENQKFIYAHGDKDG